MSILTEADVLINGARAKEYGDATESFSEAAKIYRAIRTKGRDLDAFGAEDVAKVLIALKLVRDSNSPKNRDHMLDAAGYIGLLDHIRQSPLG